MPGALHWNTIHSVCPQSFQVENVLIKYQIISSNVVSMSSYTTGVVRLTNKMQVIFCLSLTDVVSNIATILQVVQLIALLHRSEWNYQPAPSCRLSITTVTDVSSFEASSLPRPTTKYVFRQCLLLRNELDILCRKCHAGWCATQLHCHYVRDIDLTETSCKSS
jgi:hypothetical protein